MCLFAECSNTIKPHGCSLNRWTAKQENSCKKTRKLKKNIYVVRIYMDIVELYVDVRVRQIQTFHFTLSMQLDVAWPAATVRILDDASAKGTACISLLHRNSQYLARERREREREREHTAGDGSEGFQQLRAVAQYFVVGNHWPDNDNDAGAGASKCRWLRYRCRRRCRCRCQSIVFKSRAEFTRSQHNKISVGFFTTRPRLLFQPRFLDSIYISKCIVAC